MPVDSSKIASSSKLRFTLLALLSLSFAASAASPANHTRQQKSAQFASGSARSGGSNDRGDTGGGRDGGQVAGRNDGGTGNRVGSSTTATAAAFISPPDKRHTTHGRTTSGSDASPSMKRAPSPAAFTSSIKRSFGLASSSSLSMSSSSAAAKDSDAPPLHHFRASFSHSWLAHLSPEDPANLERSLLLGLGQSRGMLGGGGGHPGRPVFNGHYVRVRPTPLKNPRLVLHSPEVAADLGLRAGEATSTAFVKYFSGDVDGAFADAAPAPGEAGTIETWATPYALSIMGKRLTSNCPYGTGNGYGDGRAISVGEVVVPRPGAAAGAGDGDPRAAARYELQLKGAGQTPFCRGADGRAVLRSSIREFLASEAMHHLGVSTTRALSLIVSEAPGGTTSARPWYSAKNRAQAPPKMDDPRLARYSDAQKRELIGQLAAQAKTEPDKMVEEKCAITTRVAPSFARIGHLDLFARRVETARKTEGGITETQEYRELEDMMWHACYREFYEEAYAPFYDAKDASGAALALMDGAMANIASMVGGWIRVGFVQGNFNADNCLVAGRTMDYGPFGFLDVYHPLSAKWTGSGEHFGFMNQPNAGFANFGVLVESLLPIIDAKGDVDINEVRDEILTKAQDVFTEAVAEVMRTKMGLVGGSSETEKVAEDLWGEIEPLLRMARGDWTVFWRQLTYVAAEYSPAKATKGGKDGDSPDYEGMMTTLLGENNAYPFYDKLTEENRDGLRVWIEKWHRALTDCHAHAAERSAEATPPEETMRLANPKYTLREWMLVEAYSRADAGKQPGNPFPAKGGDYDGVRELFELCKDPYGEGPAALSAKYYRRAPDEALTAGGTAFMS